MTDFAAPWEARTYAMVRELRDRGVFTHQEWADGLGAQLRSAELDGTHTSTYRHWLAALERLVAAKGVASDGLLEHHRAAWARAADRTPHGEPITLTADDFPTVGHHGAH